VAEQVRAKGARALNSLCPESVGLCAEMDARAPAASRYGDMEYEWEHRVNTTAGNGELACEAARIVSFPLSAEPNRPYFRDDGETPCLYGSMQFTLIDLGSGKGRRC